VSLDQITKKSNRLQIETILHIVLKQFDRARFQRAEASATFGVSNNTASASPTHIR